MKESDDLPGRPASAPTMFPAVPLLSRCAVFSRIGGGFGALGLAQVLSEMGINLGGGPSWRRLPPARRKPFREIRLLPGRLTFRREPSG